MSIRPEYWEDIIPDPQEDEEAYYRFYEGLHKFKPGEAIRGNYGVYYKCTETMFRSNGEEYICNGSSHDSMHEPMDCCYCRHGVYLHTSYDIPCGRCEMEASVDYDPELYT